MNKLLQAFFLLVLLFLVATTSQAQFSQGTKTVGGGIGFETTTSPGDYGFGYFKDYRHSSFKLNLAGGYLLQDNLEAGLNLGVLSEQEKGKVLNGYNGSPSDEYESKRNTFSIGPYARYYHPITDVVGLFGQLGFNVGVGGRSHKPTGLSNAREYRIRSFDAGIRPGIILMVNENLGLEAMVGYIGYSQKAEGDKDNYENSKTVNNSFQANFNLSTVSFGFRLYLRD